MKNIRQLLILDNSSISNYLNIGLHKKYMLQQLRLCKILLLSAENIKHIINQLYIVNHRDVALLTFLRHYQSLYRFVINIAPPTILIKSDHIDNRKQVNVINTDFAKVFYKIDQILFFKYSNLVMISKLFCSSNLIQLNFVRSTP